MADPEELEEILHDVNPPNATRLFPDQTSNTTSSQTGKEEEEESSLRVQRVEILFNWLGYAAQIAVSAAVFHPFSYAKVLMELGFEPVPPKVSRTMFGKPCLALPNITSYVRFMKMRDGKRSLWTGFAPAFTAILVRNVSNDLSYHLVDELVKRTLRKSPRRAWSVFVMANSENEEYSTGDFIEDLGKEAAVRAIGAGLSYPFQVIFLRTAAQFVYKEHIYNGMLDACIKIYRSEGLRGFYSGFVPRLLFEIGTISMVWIGAFFFRKVVSRDRLWVSIFRFAADYISRTLCYPLKLVGRVMAVSPAPLKIVSPPLLPKFRTWRECFSHLKLENNLYRGCNIFMRIVTTDSEVVEKLALEMKDKAL